MKDLGSIKVIVSNNDLVGGCLELSMQLKISINTRENIPCQHKGEYPLFHKSNFYAYFGEAERLKTCLLF